MNQASTTSVCIAVALAAGCAKGTRRTLEPDPAAKYGADTVDAPTGQQQSPGWTTTPLPVASESVAVKEGSAPLVYLVESPGTFRVHDLTTGQDLARSNAAGRSIIRVDGRTGVVFGGETLFEGPLKREHRYVIFRDPTGPNMARQGVFQVRPEQNGADLDARREAGRDAEQDGN